MNIGTFSAFATAFGMKMYYFFVESKHRKRLVRRSRRRILRCFTITENNSSFPVPR